MDKCYIDDDTIEALYQDEKNWFLDYKITTLLFYVKQYGDKVEVRLTKEKYNHADSAIKQECAVLKIPEIIECCIKTLKMN